MCTAFSIIVAVLAILVTVLIGWQFAQFIFAKNTVKSVVKESTKPMIEDFNQVVKSVFLLLEAEDCHRRNLSLRAIDSSFSALQELTLCKDQQAAAYTVDKAHLLLLTFFEESKDKGDTHIPVGKRDLYLSLVRSFHTPHTWQIESLISQSLEKGFEDEQEIVPLGVGTD